MPKPNRRQFIAGSGAVLATSRAAGTMPSQPGPRNLLSAAWTPAKLASVLVPRERWKPFPAAADRAAWNGLPDDARRALSEAGERNLNAAWPSLPATLALEYVRNGDRSNYERVRDHRRNLLRTLVVAECAEGKGRFLDDVLNGIWTTCEETYWGVPAHLGLQKAGSGLPDVTEPTVDLFTAETGSLLAWTDYLLGPQLDRLSPLLRPRIRYEMDRRVLTPNFERTDFWWMGLAPKNRPVNNWNPWINSNWLTAALLLEADRTRRVATVHKIMRSLDVFLDGYADDGGCDEGPSYWGRAGASLFDCLELLHSASGGALDFYAVPLIREIGRYIYRAHIYDDYFINFADASAKVHIPGDLVFRFGRRIGDADMAALGKFAASRYGGNAARGESIGRQLPALFDLGTLRAASGSQPLVRDVWLPGIQVMAARCKQGSPEGLYLAAQGGHNAESHNHNDVGNFIVYANGQPVFIDVGVETYTAKTFSAKRYEIWTMQSAYHNLPTIGGVMQAAGREYAAREVACRADDRAAEFSLDIAKAYPAEAGLESWKRVLRLDRQENTVDLGDRYTLQKPAGRITMTLMTPCRVTRGAAGELSLAGENCRVKLLYDGAVFTPNVEEIPIRDSRLRGAWGDRLYRILLTAEKPPLRADWKLKIAQER